MSIDYIYIGKRIREQRRYLHISQEQLAELSNKSTVYISSVENAKKHPSLEAIVSICEILKLSLDELIWGKRVSYEDSRLDTIVSIFQKATENEKSFIADIVIYTYSRLERYNTLILENTIKS